MQPSSKVTETNTFAVVVLYHPGPDVPLRLEVVREQVSGLLVIDNTPVADRNSQVWQWGKDSEGVDFLDGTENLGLGVAYNRGFTEARRRGASWVLVLDQDTDLSHAFLSSVAGRLEGAGYRDSVGRPIAVVGVNFVNSAVPLAQEYRLKPIADATAVISSGSLVSVEAWMSVAGFDDQLFIDYVDTDFCLKASAGDYGVVLIGDVLMRHGMGSPASNRILGGYTRVTSNYPPLRHYYIARNFIAIARRHGRLNRKWFAAEMLMRLKFTVLSLLMEGNRRQLLGETLRGVVDGVCGRTGKRGAVTGDLSRV